jgi:hypothetical protein
MTRKTRRSTPGRPSLAARATAAGLLGLVGATNPALALTLFNDPATGTLQIGNGAPGDKNLKVEVGPAAGQVRVVDRAAGGNPIAFTGVRAIRMATGAGTDFIEFDINASQSLALDIDTGAGDASFKIQWKLPPGAASTASSLAMRSGGGRVDVELDYESETARSTFDWTTDFGGGDKVIKAGIDFKPGVIEARKNVRLANLGGGSHQVAIEVDSDAANAALAFDSGFARDVVYKVLVDQPATRLDVTAATRGARSGIEILSAAPTTVVRLGGGTANVPLAETTVKVAQTVPGSIDARLNYATAATQSKFDASFDGSASTLRLAGTLTGSPGADSIKIDSNAIVRSSLQLDAGGGDDVVDLAFARLAMPGVPRVLLGAGNDLLTLLAGTGSNATPVIDCGAGADTAKAAVGTPIGCEGFSR